MGVFLNAGHSTLAIPNQMNTSYVAVGEAGVGFGEAFGVNLSGPNTDVSVSRFVNHIARLEAGAGYGIYDSGGVQQNTTLPLNAPALDHCE